MHVTVVALGQRMPGWVDAACAEYGRRLPRDWNFSLVELKPAARDRGRSPAQLLDQEAEAIAAATRGRTLVALDERGAAWTSRDFAGRLARWRDDAVDLAFVIGSADGLAPQVKAGAAAQLALSAMTLPHGLARVLLVEQLYRAASLIAGHPYHRE